MQSPYFPDLYDLANPADFQGDVDWYLGQALRAGGPVLELGAGTGRITLPLARAGIEVAALDVDPAMLRVLAANLEKEPELSGRVQLHEADMRSFDLARRFELVLIPFRSFAHNVERDDQLRCLRCVQRHLEPRGVLAFNIYHPSLQVMSRWSGVFEGVWRRVDEFRLPNGERVIRSDTNRYDTPRQRVVSHHRYEHFDADGTLVRTRLQTLELAYLYPGDLRALLEEAGFEHIEIFGGFDERPFSSDLDELVVRARRG